MCTAFLIQNMLLVFLTERMNGTDDRLWRALSQSAKGSIFDHVSQLFGERVLLLHGFEDLCAGELVPRRRDDDGVLVVLTQQGHGGGQLLLPAAHGPPGLRHSAPGGALRPLSPLSRQQLPGRVY